MTASSIAGARIPLRGRIFLRKTLLRPPRSRFAYCALLLLLALRGCTSLIDILFLLLLCPMGDLYCNKDLLLLIH